VRVVAIDGPSGSGKSTVARAVAAALGIPPLDTGAMYRAVTLALLRTGADPTDEGRAVAVAQAMDLAVGEQIELEGRDVSVEIRSPEVTAAVSTVAAHPGVRRILVDRQRAWVERHGGGVVEGRDIGTVVFPDAPLKVFLDANDEERARRRQRDDRDGSSRADFETVMESIRRRDARDSTRAASPLVAAPDAVVIDTTGRDADQVIAEVLAHAHEVFGA